ncbi:glycine cleavage system aminomethyltransferase GcvT [Dinoroseobacter sp. PD6]|uniref:glycine cleavage system aminomethyltransferase GcvT n=1 Tax=Dinoroseobacter sp. PD6 TaxID=3028384 RepID=UPI00237B31CD|nr:glycine cleavage system aminomethyltransferase GcvT [Dinoroseobacter sp. PD6]MDD9717622.1 glycine cleavage system aminomethyltransferase GcvT [Dinoroseobacter sp. PD6]
MLKKTPLHPLHLELGAKMVPFAGWEMPVQYPTGIMAEHAACREGAALFDVSHMCQMEITGDDPAAALERLVPGGITSLAPGQARYTQLTTGAGGIYDDLIVTRDPGGLYVVANASMADQDVGLLRAGLPDCTLRVIEDHALIAVQGPAAAALVAGLVPAAEDLRFMQSAQAAWDGQDLRLSRLGYTGEDGFEISLPATAAEAFARALIAGGAMPAGLGARDTLRMEAGLPLYGQDIDQGTSPPEAGLGFSIPKRRRAEGGFPGAARILGELADGPARRLVGLRPEGRAPVRAGVEITAPDGTPLGTVTSGGFAPTLQAPISMGYVTASHAAPGTEIHVILRGKPQPATVTPLPFVPHRYKR